jgi:hypothetical protein
MQPQGPKLFLAFLGYKYEYYIPIGSMYAIYGNIYHQYTPNVSIYTIHGSYGIYSITFYASEIADFIRMWIYIFGDIANLEAWSTGMA